MDTVLIDMRFPIVLIFICFTPRQDIIVINVVGCSVDVVCHREELILEDIPQYIFDSMFSDTPFGLLQHIPLC